MDKITKEQINLFIELGIYKNKSEALKDALGYTIVYYSKEDQCWLAHCKSLDIMTHGDNETHAWEMIREAIKLYLGFD